MIKDKFFDRADILEALEKRINAFLEGYRQNIAIIGDELVGKTSIIIKFLNKFCNNRVVILYLEIRPESFHSFVKRFIGVLLYSFLSSSGMALEENLDFLIKRSEKYIPKTTERIKSILSASSRRKKDNLFSEILSLSECIHLETGKSCLVIFDEFNNLENLGIKNLYREWSKLLIAQKNTMYIIISSLKFKAKNVLSQNLSLLFGNFEIITVEPFNISSSERYLENRLEKTSLNIALKNFIVHFTGGFPFYLEVICDAIIKQAQNNLTQILENLVFDSSGILNQRFLNYIKRFLNSPTGNDCLSILYLISSGTNKIRDITHLLNKTKKELSLRINNLQELDTISRNGDFLKINDRVFAFWLKFVYHQKLNSLTLDAKNQKERFRNNIDNTIAEFLQSADKPLSERIFELLRLFENEIMQLERKRIRLNHFREIKPLEFANKNLKIGLIGRSADSLWIMAFKNEILTEEDVSEFSRECRKYRHKQQRKIFVTLQGIEANTKLKAMEEKVWAWDISNLNQILDLYSKPWIIA